LQLPETVSFETHQGGESFNDRRPAKDEKFLKQVPFAVPFPGSFFSTPAPWMMVTGKTRCLCGYDLLFLRTTAHPAAFPDQ
jgi:hypothetical protein